MNGTAQETRDAQGVPEWVWQALVWGGVLGYCLSTWYFLIKAVIWLVN